MGYSPALASLAGCYLDSYRLALCPFDLKAGDLLGLIGRLKIDVPFLWAGCRDVKSPVPFTLVLDIQRKFERSICLASDHRIGGRHLNILRSSRLLLNGYHQLLCRGKFTICRLAIDLKVVGPQPH